jgi:hypothetical protein
MAPDHFRYRIYWLRYRELTDPEHAWGKGGVEEGGGEEDAWAVETTAAEPEPAVVAAFSDPAPAAAPLSSGPVSTEGERAFWFGKIPHQTLPFLKKDLIKTSR